MIVVVTVAKVMFLVFCSDDSNTNEKVNKRTTIYGKLIGNGSVWRIMPDAVHHVTVIT